MHVYVWEHISFSTEQIQWMLTKLGRDEVALHMPLYGQIRQEVDSGQRKNRSMRVPFSNFKTSSDRNATATNQMHPRILN